MNDPALIIGIAVYLTVATVVFTALTRLDDEPNDAVGEGIVTILYIFVSALWPCYAALAVVALPFVGLRRLIRLGRD